MPHTQSMLQTHPRQSQLDMNALQQCIEACHDCASACQMCADACLGEEQIQMMIRCIRLTLDCADICTATGKVVSRQTETDWRVVRSQLQACIDACRACGQECAQHAQHGMEHCRVCAESCRRCEDACTRLLQVIPADSSAQATR